MKQSFIPAPGKIVVMREKASDKYRLRGLILDKPEDIQEYETRANPWSLVVGVGAPEVTQYGTTITTDVEPGDKVAVAQVGATLPLTTSDGETDFIYVIPFEGVMGRIVSMCGKCGYLERKGDAVMTLVCPQCGNEASGRIQGPTTADVLEVEREKILAMKRQNV